MKTISFVPAAVFMLSVAQANIAVEKDVMSVFHRFVVAQNAHDTSRVRELLWDSPNFLWVTRGTAIWGRDAAIQRFHTLFQGTWKLSPDTSNIRVVMLTDKTAQLFVPIMFNIGAPGQSSADTPFLMNQTLVKTKAGWRIASILPIPSPM